MVLLLLKDFFEKVDFKKRQQTTKSMHNFPVGKGLKLEYQNGTMYNLYEKASALIVCIWDSTYINHLRYIVIRKLINKNE